MLDDYTQELEVDAACADLNRERLRSLKWHTKDGRTISILDMDTQHLKNCVNHIQTRTTSMLLRLIAEAERNLAQTADAMAIRCFESDISTYHEHISNMDAYCHNNCPEYVGMLLELDIRNELVTAH